jgi:hypothetical protein
MDLADFHDTTHDGSIVFAPGAVAARLLQRQFLMMKNDIAGSIVFGYAVRRLGAD